MDRSSEPVDKRARKGMGRVAIIVLLIILVIFVGYNIYYLATPG